MLKNEDSQKSSDVGSESIFIEHPSRFPLNKKMAHFLAYRGAYFYLLAREFSHADCNHCEYKLMNDINLRDSEMLEMLFYKFQDCQSTCKNYQRLTSKSFQPRSGET
jgi:hypothetical protein